MRFTIHQIRRSRSKAPITRTAAVTAITTFIDHLLNARVRLPQGGESTKSRTEQLDVLLIWRIRSFIQLLAHEQQLDRGTFLKWRLIGFDSD